MRAVEKRRPEPGAGERSLDLRQQVIDRVPVDVLGADLAHQPLQRVAQVPLAQVQLGVREASTNRVREPVVVVAHDPWRSATERSQERLPIRLRLARERLQAPQPWASGVIPHRGEHAERDPEATAVRVAHPERQVVEQQRSARRPLARTMRVEHDGSEHLHPIHHQRPVPREAQLASARVGT